MLKTVSLAFWNIYILVIRSLRISVKELIIEIFLLEIMIDIYLTILP